MLFLILSIAIQAGLIVHVIKTGRNQLWVWVLLFLPGVGGVAYVAVEILPELFRSRTARRTARGFRKAMDPGADLRRYENQARIAGNVASRQRYAEELTRHERYDDAIAQYREALGGLYEHDPNLMLGLARAQFGKGDARAARETLDELIGQNPNFRSPAGHLLYAQALEAEGNVAKALEEY
ncbi:MAG: tetratricopeptide repeat protein, partial [Steroidobacteraceae bacterium]